MSLDPREIFTHRGHTIVVVTYGEHGMVSNDSETLEVAIECETCNEVLWARDYDAKEFEQ